MKIAYQNPVIKPSCFPHMQPDFGNKAGRPRQLPKPVPPKEKQPLTFMDHFRISLKKNYKLGQLLAQGQK